MDAERLLLISGIILLSISALLGFVQHRHRHDDRAFAAWRVVHAGGTAGAVQLIVLAVAWSRLTGDALYGGALALGLTIASWAFFVGPLATALNRPRVARVFYTAGAVTAVPSYLALPCLLLR